MVWFLPVGYLLQEIYWLVLCHVLALNCFFTFLIITKGYYIENL